MKINLESVAAEPILSFIHIWENRI